MSRRTQYRQQQEVEEEQPASPFYHEEEQEEEECTHQEDCEQQQEDCEQEEVDCENKQEDCEEEPKCEEPVVCKNKKEQSKKSKNVKAHVTATVDIKATSDKKEEEKTQGCEEEKKKRSRFNFWSGEGGFWGGMKNKNKTVCASATLDVDLEAQKNKESEKEKETCKSSSCEEGKGGKRKLKCPRKDIYHLFASGSSILLAGYGIYKALRSHKCRSGCRRCCTQRRRDYLIEIQFLKSTDYVLDENRDDYEDNCRRVKKLFKRVCSQQQEEQVLQRSCSCQSCQHCGY